MFEWDKRIYYRAERTGIHFKVTQKYYNTSQQVELLNIINLKIFINFFNLFHCISQPFFKSSKDGKVKPPLDL